MTPAWDSFRRRPSRWPEGVGACLVFHVFFLVLTTTACLAAIIVLSIWTTRRADRILQRWADGNRYTLVERNPLFMMSGPFSLLERGSRSIVRITVRDVEGEVRSGYVACGDWLMGVLGDGVEVRWDRPKDCVSQ